jgi:hypothetical protein
VWYIMRVGARAHTHTHTHTHKHAHSLAHTSSHTMLAVGSPSPQSPFVFDSDCCAAQGQPSQVPLQPAGQEEVAPHYPQQGACNAHHLHVAASSVMHITSRNSRHSPLPSFEQCAASCPISPLPCISAPRELLCGAFEPQLIPSCSALHPAHIVNVVVGGALRVSRRPL